MAIRMKPLNIDKENARDEEAANLLPNNANADSNSSNTNTQSGNEHFDMVKLGDFFFSFFGLLISYVTWGVMQELIMNTKFNPSPQVPSGMFPSCKSSPKIFFLFSVCIALFGCAVHQ